LTDEQHPHSAIEPTKAQKRATRWAGGELEKLTKSVANLAKERDAERARATVAERERDELLNRASTNLAQNLRDKAFQAELYLSKIVSGQDTSGDFRIRFIVSFSRRGARLN
jgi:hypothetical protein